MVTWKAVLCYIWKQNRQLEKPIRLVVLSTYFKTDPGNMSRLLKNAVANGFLRKGDPSNQMKGFLITEKGKKKVKYWMDNNVDVNVVGSTKCLECTKQDWMKRSGCTKKGG